MATWDSAYCLALFNRYAGRNTSGDGIADADKYARLSEAQHELVRRMYARVPKSLYPKGALPTMATSDQNVFTFGAGVSPMGKTRIFESMAHFPDSPWVEGVDYVQEGSQIRLVAGRTYGGTPFWYGITTPTDIDGSTAPMIFPLHFRDLIVQLAVAAYGEEGGRDTALADRMRQRFAAQFPEACLAWKTQFSNGGALGHDSGLALATLA